MFDVTWFGISARRHLARCADRRSLLSRRCDGWRNADRKRTRRAFRSFPASILACGLAFATPAAGGPACRPALTVKDAQLSPMQSPTLERRWTATVSADASRCATTAGYFEVGFSRQKENAMDLEFREQFIWSLPAVKVSVDLWADEAVETYWIDSVQACPCAK